MLGNSLVIPSEPKEGKWAHPRAEKNSYRGGIPTHDLWILITVALLAELQGQNRSRPLVLKILFSGIEASNQGLRNKH